MKKITNIIILFLVVFLSNTTFLSAQNTTADIEIHNQKGNENETSKDVGRSLIPTIEAQINTLSRLLTFTFNEPVSTVTITVTNSVGETVASSQCNTTIQPFVQLFVPMVDDTYYIYIGGNKISATGIYTIINGLII